MPKIPVISGDKKVNAFIEAQCKAMASEYSPVFMVDKDEIIAYLKYDLPEIKIMYYSDKSVKANEILLEIGKDPWLHYGGVIAIYDTAEDRKNLELLKDQNVIAIISRSELSFGFARLLKIIKQNKQILFQRGIQQNLLKTMSGSLVIDNDPLDITTYANLITNYLFNANLINKETKEKLHVALLELLINAIEHGNCKISYDEKTAWLEARKNIMDLVREKNKDPQVRAKKVYCSYSIGQDSSKFVIRDEGDGFDWRARLATKRKQPELHGMGMSMASIYVNDLTYNEKGNVVSFQVIHQRNETNIIPAIFSVEKEIVFKDGEYVCNENEESDNLYYIVSGTLYVYSKGKLVSSLTPDDLFMGEMSFLLSNKRSATVVSKGYSRLIKISKQNFVNLIKENPHYGIFLARLLAQRLAKLNLRTSRLNTEYLTLKKQLIDLGQVPASSVKQAVTKPIDRSGKA